MKILGLIIFLIGLALKWLTTYTALAWVFIIIGALLLIFSYLTQKRK
ncbi:MAG: hypothetical protein ACE5WD_12080 [Candidatus Aminicenantia bacterium]